MISIIKWFLNKYNNISMYTCEAPNTTIKATASWANIDSDLNLRNPLHLHPQING